MKICTKCKIKYPATTEYFFEGLNYDRGLRSRCKKCMAEASIKRRKSKNIIPNTDINIMKKCSVCGKTYPATEEYFFKGHCKYGLRSKCKICFYDASKELKAKPENRIKSRKAFKKYYYNNKEKFVEKWQNYYKANAEYLKEKAKEYRKDNIDKYRILDRKRREDPQFRLNNNISNSIRQSLFRGSGKNNAHWEDLVGYTRKDLVKHLEKQFVDGMTWENYGKWHLDHIIPKSAFNFTSPEHDDFKRCWSLGNLQPLWAKDNLSKNNKLEKHFQPRLAL